MCQKIEIAFRRKLRICFCRTTLSSAFLVRLIIMLPFCSDYFSAFATKRNIFWNLQVQRYCYFHTGPMIAKPDTSQNMNKKETKGRKKQRNKHQKSTTINNQTNKERKKEREEERQKGKGFRKKETESF